MLETKQLTNPTEYASRADFRQIFDEDMHGLYLLSFLLTADHEKAEQCFVSGLEDAVDGNPVFREWARSWARRAIIQNAVRLINPRPGQNNSSTHFASVNNVDKALPVQEKVEIAAILHLEPFERFVYVMTVLERYSDQEASVLLGCARRDVLAARVRTLQQLGSATEAHQQVPTAESLNCRLHDRRHAARMVPGAPSLVTSA